ncbi:MAG TPA: gluconate 2-dehydrogenase subunit 3 family protein [Acidobacteriaceae bacterium]|nr:gluconate 2-dehydrogenase subunit 3 family protein [Acidobacteriaceae bacterium]
MKRRDFILVPAKVLGGALLSSLAGELIPVEAIAAAQTMVKAPLRFFTAEEARVIQAACARIFPSDESGPGATEAGVVIYIDRQLASPYGKDKYRYTKGPWISSVPEHGYQGKETPQESYRAGIPLLGGDFPGLAPEQQDARLEGVEKTRFFELLHIHTVEGMFCDPMHGGNAGLAGWRLIGFPGPVMSYRDKVQKYYGKAYRPAPRSLEEILRYPVQPVEDEAG